MSTFLACTFSYILGAGVVSSAVSGFELYAITYVKQKKIFDTQVCNSETLRLFMKQDFLVTKSDTKTAYGCHTFAS